MTGASSTVSVPFVAQVCGCAHDRQHPALLPLGVDEIHLTRRVYAAASRNISSTVRRVGQGFPRAYQRRGARVPGLRRHRTRARRSAFAQFERTAARRARGGGGRLEIQRKETRGSAPTRTGRTELAAPFGYRRRDRKSIAEDESAGGQSGKLPRLRRAAAEAAHRSQLVRMAAQVGGTRTTHRGNKRFLRI